MVLPCCPLAAPMTWMVMRYLGQMQRKMRKKSALLFFFHFTLKLFISCIHLNGQDPYTGWECLRLGLKSRVSRCLPSPWSGGSAEGGLEQRFRIQCVWLVYSYLTKWKEILFLSLEACQRPLSLTASALLAHRPKGRQSLRYVFYFLIPPTKVRRALTMTSIEDFCALLVAVVERNGLSKTLYFYCEMETFKPFSSEYKENIFFL